jgi:hypothetical protein
MTQAQVMGHLAEKIGISKKKAKLKARIGRNPATGEQIKIPARTRLRFTPAKALTESVLAVPARAAKKKPASKPKTAAAKIARKSKSYSPRGFYEHDPTIQ